MIDTHAHLHLINRSTEDILFSAKNAGVDHIIQVAIDFPSIKNNLVDYKMYDQISITGGIHPLSVSVDLNKQTILDYISSNIDSFVAIGETGLDYKYGIETQTLQIDWFHSQLELASEFNKPVIIHSRYSDDDMLKIVNQYPHVKKVFHCYATHYSFFESLEGENNYVSFTGMITFSKKGKLANSVRNIPLNRIMIETDAPYLIPKDVSADQNEPQYVGKVAQHIAFLRNCLVDDVINQTNINAREFFNL